MKKPCIDCDVELNFRCFLRNNWRKSYRETTSVCEIGSARISLSEFR